jgi:hypothetical protein
LGVNLTGPHIQCQSSYIAMVRRGAPTNVTPALHYYSVRQSPYCKAFYQGLWDGIVFVSAAGPSADAGQRKPWHVPGMTCPANGCSLFAFSTARSFAVNPFKNRDQPGALCGRSFEDITGRGSISHRAINLRPVQSQKAEGVGLPLQPNLDPTFANRIDILGYRSFWMDKN